MLPWNEAIHGFHFTPSFKVTLQFLFVCFDHDFFIDFRRLSIQVNHTLTIIQMDLQFLFLICSVQFCGHCIDVTWYSDLLASVGHDDDICLVMFILKLSEEICKCFHIVFFKRVNFLLFKFIFFWFKYTCWLPENDFSHSKIIVPFKQALGVFLELSMSIQSFSHGLNRISVLFFSFNH